jgi:hypothetical protein
MITKQMLCGRPTHQQMLCRVAMDDGSDTLEVIRFCLIHEPRGVRYH